MQNMVSDGCLMLGTEKLDCQFAVWKAEKDKESTCFLSDFCIPENDNFSFIYAKHWNALSLKYLRENKFSQIVLCQIGASSHI